MTEEKAKAMYPTFNLRWVKRKSWEILAGPSDGLGNVLILQQWFVTDFLLNTGEWCDVPIEEEK